MARKLRHPGDALWRSEERFRLLVESVRDYAIFMLDEKGIVESWNAGAERIKGYKAREIIGRSFEAFYTEEERRAGKPARNLAKAAAEGRYEEEDWRVRKDGSRFWALVVLTALREPSGRLIGFAKVTRDLTERRRAEESLRAALEDLRRSNKELDEYAAFASHDLQEPLRKLSAYSDLLLRRYAGKLDDRAQTYLRYLTDSAARLQQLVRDLLDYSRIGRTAQRPAEPVDLKAVARAVLGDLEVQIKGAGARVEVGSLPRVKGDRALLSQVLQNLVSNAVKYRSGKPPRIKLSSKRRGGAWVVTVADNGIGIEPEYRERIFEPFRRLHGKDAYPGTGIGLAICKKIVELCGGRIWVESAPGKGSAFSFTLPDARRAAGRRAYS